MPILETILVVKAIAAVFHTATSHHVSHHAIKKGVEKGIKKGVEKGIQKGIGMMIDDEKNAEYIPNFVITGSALDYHFYRIEASFNQSYYSTKNYAVARFTLVSTRGMYIIMGQGMRFSIAFPIYEKEQYYFKNDGFYDFLYQLGSSIRIDFLSMYLACVLDGSNNYLTVSNHVEDACERLQLVLYFEKDILFMFPKNPTAQKLWKDDSCVTSDHYVVAFSD